MSATSNKKDEIEFLLDTRGMLILRGNTRSLTRLQINESYIADLPPDLPPTLEDLNLNNNILVNLGKLPGLLEELNVGFNQFRELPDLPNSLLCLYACSNELWRWKSMKFPPGLKILMLDLNFLRKVPELPESLTYLSLKHNQLKRLKWYLPRLKFLSMTENPLTEFPKLSDTVESVFISNSNLRQVGRIPDNIKRLHIFNNGLMSLPSVDNVKNFSCTLISFECEQFSNQPANFSSIIQKRRSYNAFRDQYLVYIRVIKGLLKSGLPQELIRFLVEQFLRPKALCDYTNWSRERVNSDRD